MTLKPMLDPITFETVRGEDLPKYPGLLNDVLDLQKQWIVNRHVSETPQGFLISQFDPRELANILAHGGVLYCARQCGALVGYLLVTPIQEFTSLYGAGAGGVLVARDGLTLTDQYRYLYQIAARRDLSRSGVGRSLLKIATDQEPVGLVTDILTSPFCNEASLRFFERQGFCDIGHLELDGYRDFGKLTSRVLMWRR